MSRRQILFALAIELELFVLETVLFAIEIEAKPVPLRLPTRFVGNRSFGKKIKRYFNSTFLNFFAFLVCRTWR